MAPTRSTKYSPKYVTPSSVMAPPGLVRSGKKSNTNKINSSLPIPPPPPCPPPPGLVSSSLEPASGSEGTSVRISGLPNHILSKAMLEAILDQSQLDKDVLSFVTRPGNYRGEAIITLKSKDAATRCAQHFDGRSWDVSGIKVTAKVLGEDMNECIPVQSYAGHYLGDDSSEVADPRLDDLKLLSSYEARIDMEGGWDNRNMDTFGADCCDHDDLVAQVFGNSSMLSASAPVFVPGKMLTTTGTETQRSDESTDVSTEDGDSASSCDEKDSAVLSAVAVGNVSVKWQ